VVLLVKNFEHQFVFKQIVQPKININLLPVRSLYFYIAIVQDYSIQIYLINKYRSKVIKK